MAIKTALLSIGGSVALVSLMSGPAFAGGPSYCGNVGAGHGQSQGCDTGVSYVRTPTGYSGPTTIENRTPYDYFDSVHFQRSPHVSITRIHSLAPSVGLADSPVSFTPGCHPQSTAYCRSEHSSRVTSTVSSAPTYAPAPTPQPTYAPAPVMAAPTPMPPRVVAYGGGFDPSKFAPRIYGDPYTITPGIAYLPTTVVDRNPYRAQAVLDAGPGGVTPALTGMPIGPLPTPRPYSPRPYSANAGVVQPRMMQAPMMMRPQVQPRMVQTQMMRPPMMPQPMMQRPMMQPSIPTGYPGAAGAPYQMSNGRYGSRVGADGTYWEKVSGPTQYGNTVASQVICKRRLPQPGPTKYPPAPCNGHVAHQSPHHSGQSSRY